MVQVANLPGWQEVEAQIREGYDYGCAIRQTIHCHPELSGHEHATSALLQQELTSMGYSIATIPHSESFLAYRPSGVQPLFGLRAELDALPIQEATEASPRSETNGVMHACGHDLHMGIALGFAKALSRLDCPSEQVPLFVFESSEEVLPGGAQAILESAAFTQHRPRRMLCFHSEPSLSVGTVGVRAGRYMASGDELHMVVKGRGGHAAMPEKLADPLLAACDLVLQLQAVSGRLAPAQIPTVLTVGRLVADGATNVVPDVVQLEGTFRTHDETWRAQAKELICTIAAGVAKVHDVTIDVHIEDGYPALFNDTSLADTFERLCGQASLVVECQDLDFRMTTDDFAYFAQAMPSLFIRLGVGPTGALHTSSFAPREEAIRVALQLLYLLLGHFSHEDGKGSALQEKKGGR